MILCMDIHITSKRMVVIARVRNIKYMDSTLGICPHAPMVKEPLAGKAINNKRGRPLTVKEAGDQVEV